MRLTRNAMGLGLRVLNRIAGLESMDRLGLRKPAESVIYGASRAGFATAGAASRVFRSTRALLQPSRQDPQRRGDLFDFEPTPEQSMLRDACLDFAREQLRPAALQASTPCRFPSQSSIIAAESSMAVGLALPWFCGPYYDFPP